MGSDVRITGAEELEALSRRLKASAAGDLRKELLKGIRESGKPTVRDVKASARERLPHSGGLAAKVAGSTFGLRTRTSGNTVGVRIVGNSRSVKSLRALNSGVLRHPVFGHDVWVSQNIAPGFFSDPIEKDADHIRDSIRAAMAEVARKLERPL